MNHLFSCDKQTNMSIVDGYICCVANKCTLSNNVDLLFSLPNNK